MANNEIKPFATGANANVTPQAEWENLPALLTGFSSGKASSAQVNKAIRQASFVAATLAQFIADQSGEDVRDDGDQAGLVAKMLSAINKTSQPLDETLVALAALATGANKLPYFTGEDTAGLTDLTATGREIIGKGSIADVLSYLGLSEAPNALNKNNNLSELTDRAAARKNLGLGEEASVSLGVNQRWQIVTSSRSVGVTYTNTTGKPIQLLLDFVRPNTSWVVNVQIDGVSVTGAGGYCPVIPNNSTYRVDASGIANLTWRELR